MKKIMDVKVQSRSEDSKSGQKVQYLDTTVVYFDQQTGTPHAVHWSKSFF